MRTIVTKYCGLKKCECNMIELLLCCISLIIGFFFFKYSINVIMLVLISVIIVIIGKMKNDKRYAFIILSIVSYFYTNYMTYERRLEENKDIVIYSKIDGKNGTIIKIENKYLTKVGFIKNNKKLTYGNYLVIYRVKSIKEDKTFITLDGEILGYKSGRLNNIRLYISEILDDILINYENLHAFSKASILGEKVDVTKNMNDKFKYTGLAHLVVISGSHISLIIIWTVKLLDKINVDYKRKYIVAFVILTFYCSIVGLSPAILRAYFMGALMILSRLLFEEEDSIKSFLISFILIFILNPYAVIDISLQLSYMAVGTMIFVYPHFEKMYRLKFYKVKGLLDEINKILILSICIQLMSTPIFLLYFKKLPLFSFLLNIVGIPVGTILIESLFLLVFLNFIKIEVFNMIIVQIVKFIYNAFEGFIYFGSRIPFLQLNLEINLNFVWIIIYYLFFLSIILIIKEKNIKYEKIANDRKRKKVVVDKITK